MSNVTREPTTLGETRASHEEELDYDAVQQQQQTSVHASTTRDGQPYKGRLVDIEEFNHIPVI